MDRKHRNQMTPDEITFAETLIHSIQEWDVTGTDHARSEAAFKPRVSGQTRGQSAISKQDIINTLKYGNVIELNDRGRLVVRLMKGKRAGTCVVVSIRDRKVVTVWYNDPRDTHATLRLSEYTWNVNVIDYLRSQQ